MPFLLFFFLLSVVLGALQSAAISFSLYWELPWFDALMHFLGGAWIVSALFPFVFFYSRRAEKNIPPFVFLLLSIAFFLPVAVSWEVLEFQSGLTFAHKAGYVLDTFEDILAGLLGALLLWKRLSKHLERTFLV